MKIIHASDQVENIGFETENVRTQVYFDLSDVMEEFPGGYATLAVRRPGETKTVLPTNVEMVGTDLVWTVSAYEIEMKGIMQAQIVYVVDETIAKTKIYKFIVSESLIGDAPGGWEDWVDELAKAAAGVNKAIDDAEETLDYEVGLAQTAREGAETAQGKAETAQSRAETAQGLAQSAQVSANASMLMAQAAQRDAEIAKTGAETAQRDAESAKTTAQNIADEIPTTVTTLLQEAKDSGEFDGVDGITFTPAVSSEGVISWTNDGGQQNPESVNIKGPQGEAGHTPVRGTDYWTAEDQAEITSELETYAGDLLLIQDEEPTEEANKIWMPETSPAGVQVPTYEEFSEVANDYTTFRPATDGTSGQLLKSNGDGTTEWTNVGTPTDAQVGEAVEAWLDDHPEATTTVQDGSISRIKLDADLRQKTDDVETIKSAITSIEDVVHKSKDADISLTSSDNKTGYINPSTGAITGSEYKVLAYALTDEYAKVSVYAYHVAPQYRYAAFYSADDLADCGEDTLVGDVFAYTNNIYVAADVPRGAKMLCVAVYTIPDSNNAKVIKEYYPITDDIDDLSEGKVDIDQGSENAGKALVINEDGEVEPGEAGAPLDTSLTRENYAAEAHATGIRIGQVFSAEAKELLMTILTAGVYTSNQSTNIANLVNALGVIVVSKSGKTLVLSNVPTITSITQNGRTLVCA